MPTLITGGTGFIGAEVVRLLAERGASDVTVFDVNPVHDRLRDLAAQVHIVRGDVGCFGNVLDIVERCRPSVIYHLGAMLSAPSEADPAAALQVNALGTYHVLEAARLFGVNQVLFTSSVGTYGDDITADTLDDTTLQRPVLLYGITKLFGEHLGRYYRRRYGLDVRGVRYPAIIGPSTTTPSVGQMMAWIVEQAVRGIPYALPVGAEVRLPVLYYKDAARALVQLAAAPREAIQTIIYLLAGVTPPPSVGEIVASVKVRLPAAPISFAPDSALERRLEGFLRPIDDANARREWGWQSAYDLEEMIDDCIAELA